MATEKTEQNIQEMSNRTHWTDPQTWVFDSSSKLVRGPLVRSHLIFDGKKHQQVK